MDAPELYRKYRPSSLKQMVGQTDAIKTLVDLAKRDAIPHCLLFTGPSGCGKTTLARILRVKLNCSDADYKEINAAESRGIDTIRDIQQRMGLAAINGGTRVWCLDECFAPGTKITTHKGNTNIENVCVGDIVRNIDGLATVGSVFVNKVELNRVVKLTFDNGYSTFTTAQHEYLTEKGWVEASKLTPDICILSDVCNTMTGKESLYEHDRKSVSSLSLGIQNTQSRSGVLFKKLCRWLQGSKEGPRSNKRNTMPRMRKVVRNTNVIKMELQPLFEIVCSQSQKQNESFSREGIHQEDSYFDQQHTQGVLQDREGCGASRIDQGAFYRSKQNKRHSNSTKEQTNKGEKRYVTHLASRAWREWEDNSTTATPFRCVTELLGFGISNTNKNITETRCDLPDKLQSRLGSFGSTTSRGSRRCWSRNERRYLARCQENNKTSRVRVVSVEVYEQGCNDKSFEGIIGNIEKGRGFVNFYDLEIEGHPSYFADGLPVHNCHRFTNDAQSSLLKLLEDTPSHVYFMLATTDPQKLLPTIKTRSTEIKLKGLSVKELTELVVKVAGEEDKKLSEDVVSNLVDAADGSARKALVLLHSVIGLATEDEQLAAIVSGNFKAQAIEIARALLNPATKWPDMAKLLKAVEEEPETIRWIVLGYCNTILLSGGKNCSRAADIIGCFEKNFYDSKKAGLSLAAWDVLNK